MQLDGSLYFCKGSRGSLFYAYSLISSTDCLSIPNDNNMPYKYSLFVNGRHLGPYERRMIVGMRVKNIVTDDQLVQRIDGLDLTVAELMQDRLEAMRMTSPSHDSTNESRLGAPSSGMWPRFSVRFGGGPMKPGALGFSGAGHISYLGDELHFKGNRRNANLGMSKQEECLPIGVIDNSSIDDCFIDFILKPSQQLNPGDPPQQIRVECTTAEEAKELWELVNMRPRDMPHGLSYAKTAANELC